MGILYLAQKVATSLLVEVRPVIGDDSVWEAKTTQCSATET